MIRDFEQEVDKIIIRDREFSKISAWAKSVNWLKERECRHFFPLNTFILDLEVKHTKLFALIELKNFDPVAYMHVTTDQWELTEIRQGEGWDTSFELVDGNSIKSDYAARNFASATHAIILDVLLYIEAVAKEKRRQYRLSPDLLRKQREEYQYKDRECFFADDIIEYAKLHPTRSSIQYRCECWGVRGHFRHYEVGKVVFIKPYKKGKKRDILEPESKDYLIERGVEK